MGEIIQIEDPYRQRVYPMPVRVTRSENAKTTYDPMPGGGWSSMEINRWLLGIINACSTLTVILKSDKKGRYSLQLGANRRPILELTESRVTDVLAGAAEVVMLMREST
jgi:hypothetical protein